MGSDGIKITKAQALEIKKMKWGINGGSPTAKPTEAISLPELGTFQVKDVRNILNDDKDSNRNEAMEFRMAKQKTKQEEINAYRLRIKNWDPIKKAERMLKTYCYLCYRGKGNDGMARDVMMNDPIYSILMKPLVEYFEKNKNEIHAPREIYQDLMPATPSGRVEVDGWKSMASNIK